MTRSTEQETRTASKSSGFDKYRGQSYLTEDGQRRVEVDKITRMHKFGKGYSDTARERTAFSGTQKEAQMLYEVLGQLIDTPEDSIVANCDECGLGLTIDDKIEASDGTYCDECAYGKERGPYAP